MVLDAGCGPGDNYGKWLAARAGTYVGVDVSEHAVKRACDLGLDARVVTDLANLEFPDDSFDLIVYVEVLEHLISPAEAAAEGLRVLKPGGRLLATVPNIAYWRRRLDLTLLGRWHPGGHPDGSLYPWRDPHLRFFTRSTLRRMLTETGFHVREVRGINGSLLGDLPFVAHRFGSERLSRPFEFLQTVAPSVFGANLAVVADKPMSP